MSRWVGRDGGVVEHGVRMVQVGVIGFCMGGALTFLAAEHAGVDAAAPFYGATSIQDRGKRVCMVGHGWETQARTCTCTHPHMRASAGQEKEWLGEGEGRERVGGRGWGMS